MDIAHILLGRPWLYDLIVPYHGRENSYTFWYLNKSITLNPCRPKEELSSPSPKPSPYPHPSVCLLHLEELSLLHHRLFERLENSNKFNLTILPREQSLDSISFPNSHLVSISMESQLRLMSCLRSLPILFPMGSRVR